MLTSLAHVSILVKDYDEAVEWYTKKLGLELRRNDSFGEGYRWVTVGVKGQNDIDIVLHKPPQAQPGEGSTTHGAGHGFVFFTDDCRKEAERLRKNGVKVTQGPEEAPWGVQAVFEDLYGNMHVLVQPSQFGMG